MVKRVLSSDSKGGGERRREITVRRGRVRGGGREDKLEEDFEKVRFGVERWRCRIISVMDESVMESFGGEGLGVLLGPLIEEGGNPEINKAEKVK